MFDTVCNICLIEHDEEIHAATISLHQWLRETVAHSLLTGDEERGELAAHGF